MINNMKNNIFNVYPKNNNNIINKEDISYRIKVFNHKLNKLTLNINDISKTLNRQIIVSNFLIKEIILEKQYSKKLIQLYNRIEMLEDSRKLLEQNIKSINYNITNFCEGIQKLFLFEKKKNDNINLDEINNNIEYKTALNNNYIAYGDNKINNIDYNKFHTINYDYNKRTNNRGKKRNKSQNNKTELVINYINSPKIYQKNNSSFKISSLKDEELENFINKKDINDNHKNKKSRNPIRNQYYNYSSNSDIAFNSMNKGNNPINNIVNITQNKNIINTNQNYSIHLAKNVIRFIVLIKEMKMKYNKKDSIYDLEFKKTKSLYDKLKIYIMNLSKKVLDIYKNRAKNNNNKNSKDKIKFEGIKNKNLSKSININSNKILIIENNENFSFVNFSKNQKVNEITKEISFLLISDINPSSIRNFSQIHENELKIMNQIINKGNDNNNNIINELQNKIKTLIEEQSKYKTDVDIENKTEESKVDKEQLELLLNENQELKNQIEEYKERNNISNSNSKEDIEKYYQEIINENESKMKFLFEQNKYYENELKKYKENTSKENNDIAKLKIENSKIKEDLDNIKNENHILNQKIKEYNIKNNLEEIIPDKYEIACEKNYENLCWVLFKEKNGEENNYENFLWIEKNLVKNLDKFNFMNEEDAIKLQIMNYISQLEEKESIIFKLKQKLNKYEKPEN